MRHSIIGLLILLLQGSCVSIPSVEGGEEKSLGDILTRESPPFSLIEDSGAGDDLVVVEMGAHQKGYLFKEDLLQTVEKPRLSIQYPLDSQDPQSFDVPIVINERVEYFIRFFTTQHREHFTKWLSRSSRYLPMIRQIFREYGLPEDLAYLAMIESGFSTRAYSRAHAVGIWQFISSTARKYGLRIDGWVDERRDPVKSTYAAARYLSDLHQLFGSWYLAAAAYNAGEGRISRGLRRHDADDFWQLAQYRYLRRETRDYVPKFVAAMLIAKDPERYGFIGIRYEEPLQYEEISIDGSYSLSVIAEASGTTTEMIRLLNPELRRYATPPDRKSYSLRLPPGTGELALTRLAAIPPEERSVYAEHRVQRGETLSLIAGRYGVQVNDIVQLNRLRSPHRIKAGQKLLIPTRGISSVVPANYVVDENGGRVITHKVRRGESLWLISKLYNVSVRQLKRWNNIGRGSLIHPGDRLKIYLGSSHSEYAQNGGIVLHRVERGESLWSIANRYGVTVSQIQQWNGLGHQTRIYPGDSLKIYTVADPI